MAGALPRAWVAGAQRTVRGSDAALAAFTRRGFPARAVAVTEGSVPGVAQGAGAPAGAATITRYAAEDVTVRADARRAGLLVLGDLFYPGWKARLDGRPAPVHRVDDIYRGVAVPAGRHVVTFSYEPLSWRIGRDVTLVALAGLAAALLASVRRRT